ncbi:WG repeat-containing protein [Hymenobacter sp. ASUV-10]|uniref:WG repeat-containing protein n=1 Tax=Hymenobacter aranciens TaxID=3063996 RepID=A0ABT9B7V9_9BACT|nr:WG repeat-containing protein [Hymenobacter sp. ASUV-10]MDO7874356.1 WG repeat-containing protein [Hymenobacter sp. ASUV-10]
MRHRYHLLPASLLASLLFARVGAAQTLLPVALETMAGEKIGYKNTSGAVVIKPRFDEANAFEHGLATVRIGTKYGMVDSTGREVLPLKFRALSYFHDGLAAASLDGQKYGFVDRTGTFVIAPTFAGVSDFSERRAVAVQGQKLALLNTKGTLLTPFKYQGMEAMKGGIARVCLKNDSRDGAEHSHYWGFIDANGREICPLNNYGYESPNLENGYAVRRIATPEGGTTMKGQQYTFKVGQRYRYASALIDKTGKVIIPASAGYEFGNWGDHYIIVQKGPAYGVVDMAGKLLLPVNFYEIGKFEYGEPNRRLAKVTTTAAGKFFYVDEQFKCVDFDGVKCPEY